MCALLNNLMANDQARVATPGKIARDSHGAVVAPASTAAFDSPRQGHGLLAERELSRHVR